MIRGQRSRNAHRQGSTSPRRANSNSGPSGPVVSALPGVGCGTEASSEEVPAPGRFAPVVSVRFWCVLRPPCGALSRSRVGARPFPAFSRPPPSHLPRPFIVAVAPARASLHAVSFIASSAGLEEFPSRERVPGSTHRTLCAPTLMGQRRRLCHQPAGACVNRGEDPGRTPKEAGTQTHSVGSESSSSIGVLPPQRFRRRRALHHGMGGHPHETCSTCRYPLRRARPRRGPALTRFPHAAPV